MSREPTCLLFASALSTIAGHPPSFSTRSWMISLLCSSSNLRQNAGEPSRHLPAALPTATQYAEEEHRNIATARGAHEKQFTSLSSNAKLCWKDYQTNGSVNNILLKTLS
eukprot:m.271956 g.271956  ORF g.271956 m.271956 type:complete len:110 (-) comp19746_c0_seq48:2872-3201(-)